MATKTFDRDSQAKWYARQHLKVDPGVRVVFYLPTNSPEREIRFVEVNDQIAELNDDSVEPFDFGVDFGRDDEHTLWVLDVTLAQWERIQREPSLLPAEWSLSGKIEFGRDRAS